MPNRSHATTKPVSTKRKSKKQENLIHLEGNPTTNSLPNELNTKIAKIDADLDELRSNLSDTNKGVKTSLIQLKDKDKDLTSKVSDTYQQLGDLDNAYKSLTDKSAHISKEIKSISKQIVQITDKSDSDIGVLNEAYQSLIERTDELAKKSKLTTQSLNKSIRDNAKSMGNMEKQLLTEIDQLAKTTQERDDHLSETTNEISHTLSKAEEDIRSSQARMIKLQAVDQALEKRVTALDTTASELTKKSRDLSRATSTLNQRTTELFSAIEALQLKTDEHSGFIHDLQTGAEKTARALVSLILLEKRHFRLLTSAIALLLVAFIGFVVIENGTWKSEQQINASLSSSINTTAAQLASTNSQVSQMGVQMVKSDNAIHGELNNINDKLVTISDKIESVDGRVTNIRPQRTFGSNNVVHSHAWLAKQPSTNLTIHLATVAEKQALYKLAERYNTYLKDDLAYLPVSTNNSQQYALVYGSYTSQADAEAALSQLPRYIDRHRPSLHSIAQVQSFIPN